MPKLSTIVLNESFVRSLRPKSHRFEIRDSQLRGFMLRVNPNGRKSYYVQLDRYRKRKIGDTTVLTAALARYRARDMLIRSSAAAGKVSTGHRATLLGEFLHGRYRHWKRQRSRYAESDCRRLQHSLDELCEQRLELLGHSALQRWKLQRLTSVRPSTFNRELAALKAALNKAVEWGLVGDNPAQNVQPAPQGRSRRVRMLNPAERGRLEAAFAERDGYLPVMVTLALNTGLQRAELFRLRWQDVRLGPFPAINAVPYSTSTPANPASIQDRSRRVPLNQQAAQVLNRWRDEQHPRGYLVFPGRHSTPLKSIAAAWKQLMRDAGIRDFRLSDCRHDFAVRLVRAGVPLVQLRDLLGHSTIQQTERYAAHTPGRLEEAVARLDAPPGAAGSF